LGKTPKQWKAAFLAYFRTARASNGGTEAINGLIELHRRWGLRVLIRSVGCWSAGDVLAWSAKWVVMVRSLMYALARRAVELMVPRPRGDVAKDVDPAVLCHRVVVWCRQITRPRPEPRDRMLLAAFSRVLPRQRRSVFLVAPATLWRRHREPMTGKRTYGYRNPTNQRLRTRCATSLRARGSLDPDHLKHETLDPPGHRRPPPNEAEPTDQDEPEQDGRRSRPHMPVPLEPQPDQGHRGRSDQGRGHRPRPDPAARPPPEQDSRAETGGDRRVRRDVQLVGPVQAVLPRRDRW
jgi:hypothetical protein